MSDNWQLKAILSAADNMSPVLKQVGMVAKSTRKYLLDVGKSASNLSGKVGLPFAAISGVMGGFSLMAIKNAVVGFGEMGEAVHKGAIKTGMSVEQFQKMKYVAEMAGVGVEQLEGAMGKLNMNMGNAVGGKNKNVEALFKKLGISARDANGHLKAGVDILPQLADAFVRNKDPVTQARMGMALFGKKWQEIAPMLMQGGAGIAETLERMKRFKGVMSPEDIEGAVQFNKSLKDLDFVAKGFHMTIAKNLAPVLKPLIDDFATWAAANKKLIATNVAQMVKDLATWIKGIDWKKIAQDVSDLAGYFGSFVDFVGGAKNALIALVVFMNAGTIMAFAGLIGSVIRASLALLGMAANAYLAGNAGLLSMARGAAVALFTAGPLGLLSAAFTWMGGAAVVAGGLVSGAMGMAGAAVRGLGAAMRANPLGILLGIATAAYMIYQNWDTLKSWFTGFFDWIGDKFKSMLGWIVDVAKSTSGFFGMGTSAQSVAASSVTAPSAATAPGGVSIAAAGAPFAEKVRASPVVGADRPSLLGPMQQLSAAFRVSFENAPPGTRVEQIQARGNVDTRTDVGYRSYATGMPS